MENFQSPFSLLADEELQFWSEQDRYFSEMVAEDLPPMEIWEERMVRALAECPASDW